MPFALNLITSFFTMELILPFQNYPYSQQSPKIATKKMSSRAPAEGFNFPVEMNPIAGEQHHQSQILPIPGPGPAVTALLLIVTAPGAVTVRVWEDILMLSWLSPIECKDKALKEMGTLQGLSTQWNLACLFGTLPNSLNN